MKLFVTIYKSKKRRNWIANVVKTPRKNNRALRIVPIDIEIPIKRKKG
jgi:hypothetical protein